MFVRDGGIPLAFVIASILDMVLTSSDLLTVSINGFETMYS